MLNLIISFIVFSFVASITPGPTNILALGSGMRAGIRHTLPFVLGASASAATILFLTFLGFAEIVTHYPVIRKGMAFCGVIWLTYMAWKLYSNTDIDYNVPQTIPSSRHGAALQVINPKTWMMALSASSLFAPTDLPPMVHGITISAIFFIVTCPSMTAWVALGAAAQHKVKSPHHQKIIFRGLAFLLLGCSWWVFLSEVV